MEMDSNPITKPSKKRTILSAVFYALAAWGFREKEE